jgi:hypothetical protein
MGASKAVTSYQPHPAEVDLGVSDTRLVAAKTVIAYGDSGLGKSTNFRYAAQWLYELTGLPVRLISAEDSSKQIFEPLIQIGVVKPLFLTKSLNPIPTLRRLSRGEWPVFESGVIKSWLPWAKSCSGYILEGLSSIAEQIQEDCREKGRFLGEQKENTYQESGETITLAGRFSYGFVQLEVIRLLRGFAMIDGIERVFWSAHESKGVEEGSNLQIRGPQLVGSAKTGSVQKYCGLLLHFDGYPTTVKVGQLSVIETRVRIWYQRHPDMAFTHISYPAKTTVPVEALARLHDKYPGGYFEPLLQGSKLTPNLADFLAFERSIVSVSTDELAVWKRQVDANLKGESQ